MSSPAIDGNAGAIQSGVGGAFNSFNTAGLTTTAAAGLVVVVLGFNADTGSQQTVSGITGGGLTFSLRKGAHGASSPWSSEEVWTAPWAGGALSAQAFAVTFSGTVDGCAYCVFALTGLHSTAAPFDSNGACPQGTPTTGTQTATISTSQANDFILWMAYTAASQAPGTPTSFTQIAAVGGYGLNLYNRLQVAYLSVSSTQSGLVVTSLQSAGSAAVYLDAFTADAIANLARSYGYIFG